ncbi:MAG: NDP-sugar synthase [bacterium]|nr:NDP-sugar synthase [bacterium]
MKAFIMAAGEGTRLRPLTYIRPKPLVPLGNRPIITRIISLLKTNGITDIIINLHYKKEKIKDCLGDGKDFGVNIMYSEEEILLGTAGGVKKVEDILPDTFVVISGDIATDINIGEMIAFHKKKNALVTLAVTIADDPTKYGVVSLNSDGKIQRFLEKPSRDKVFSPIVNAGIYVLEKEVLKEVPEGVFYDFGKQLFPALMEKQAPLYGYLSSGYWMDIGSIADYKKVHNDIGDGKLQIPHYGELFTDNVRIGTGTYIDKANFFGSVFIGNGVKLEEGVTIVGPSFIGDSVKIEKGTKIEGSIIWNNVHIEESATIIRSVIGDNSKILKESYIVDGVFCKIPREAIDS